MSVIVPTLNEGAMLPGLLDALAGQTRPLGEVIVADGGSSDDTRAVALAHGARVVDGGPPGVGRNAGARAATGDLLLFLDADGMPSPTFVERAVSEFVQRGLDVATAAWEPREPYWDMRVAARVIEAWLRSVEQARPHAVGACLLVTRAMHERLDGFDERLALAEDHDYARRGAALGRFAVLNTVRIPTSMRRVLMLGRPRFVWFTLTSELRWLAGRPPRRLPPGWELGGRPEPDAQAAPVAGVRTRLGRLRRTLARPSTEVQGDAVAAVALAAVVAATAHRRAGTPARLVWAAALVALAASAAVGLAAVRQERRYGRFFSTRVATASDHLVDAAGDTVARAGEDVVCEFHAVHHLRALAALRRQGEAGRLAARLEIFRGIEAFADDVDDPRYRDVVAIVARSGVARALLRLGFTEIPPPRLDLANRTEKWLLRLRVGPSAGLPDCLVAMSRARWEHPDTRRALAAEITALREALARTGHSGTPGAGAGSTRA